MPSPSGFHGDFLYHSIGTPIAQWVTSNAFQALLLRFAALPMNPMSRAAFLSKTHGKPMKNNHLALITGGLLLALTANVSFAGGRYTNPPDGLVETYDLCTKALEAAKKGDKDATLESTKQARKISITSYKEISTMPMEIASSSTKKALAALDAGDVAGAIPHLEHCTGKLADEIDYYKKEGKL